jgi:hypothetical protein
MMMECSIQEARLGHTRTLDRNKVKGTTYSLDSALRTRIRMARLAITTISTLVKDYCFPLLDSSSQRSY